MSRRVLTEVLKEVQRQHTLWGEQNHPMVTPGVRGNSRLAAEEYEMPTAERAQYLCGILGAHNQLTYMHILLEEVAEFLEAAALDDPEHARGELVQVAAVAVSMIEAIDRKKGAFELVRDHRHKPKGT
jgi:NTP pyrophosphatase (non-canonical NTP hydrolase)